MKLFAYSIFDSKSKAFSQPFFTANDGMAIRTFTTLVMDKQTNVGRFPHDFSLHNIGIFDDETAELQATQPINLGLAAQFTE